MNTKLLLALFLATVSMMAIPQVYAQLPQPLVGTCLSDSQCDIVTLTNGTLMDNPYNPSLLITKAPIPQAETCTGNCPLAAIEEAQTQLQIQEEIETTVTEDSGEDEGAADENEPAQDGGCQEEDTYCDADENCRSEGVDCIDDRGFDEDDYNG